MTRVPILMYHSIGGQDRLAVSTQAFAAQMMLLNDFGFTPITLAGLIDRTHRDRPLGAVSTSGSTTRKGTGRTLPAPLKALPPQPVVITFDDGYADVYDRALPVLDRYDFPATVFVTTGWVCDAGRYAAGRPLGPMLSWRGVEELAAHGVEIGAHGHSHAPLDQLPDTTLRMELTRSKELLENRLNRPITTMAYPYGYSSARVRHAVRRAAYDAACAVANTVAADHHDLLALPRLTVRATTSLTTFGRIVTGDGLPLIFLKDHALTKGWAAIRRSRYALRRVRPGSAAS